MGFGKLLTILILAWLGYLAYKRFISASNRHKKPRIKTVEKTVRCALCQLHIPEHEALTRDGRYYCSQEHLESDKHGKG